MSNSRVSFVPSTILTTSTNALAGSNGAVTFLNKPFAGQPSTLSSTGTFKMTLPRSSTSGQGSQLESINIAYTVEENAVAAVVATLSTQSFGPGSITTAIPTTPSGFTLVPGSYIGVITVDTPSYANDADPEYFILNVSVTVDTSVVTELRINDIELVYQENVANSLPTDVNIGGYLNVGSAGPPSNTTAGDTTTNRLFAGSAPDYTLFTQPSVLAINGVLQNTSTSGNNVAANIGQVLTPPGSFSGNGIGMTVGVEFSPTDPAASISNITALVGRTGISTPCGAITSMVGVDVTNRLNSGANPTSINIIRGATIAGIALASGCPFTGNIAAAVGARVQAFGGSAGVTCSVTKAVGLEVSNISAGSATITNIYGIDIINQGNAAAALSAGIHFGAITGSATNYGIWFETNNTNASAGIVFGGSADTSLYRGGVNQLMTPGDWASRHYLCTSTPTVAAGAGAGTSPTISIVGTDHGFTVTLTTGTTATINAALFTVTFGAAWTSLAPAVTWNAGNVATAAVYGVAGKVPFISAVSGSSMTFTSGTIALSDSTTHIFRFTAMR